MYNGGPMQAPFVSDETLCPIDLSPDIYIISGTLTELSTTSVEISVTIGNHGIVYAPANTPIRYYHTDILPGNILASANTTLGVNLLPGQTTVITQIITGLTLPDMFFVRLLDDGVNFPALGAFSDCDLTNNTKSFGTLELTKDVDSQFSCIDNIRIFSLNLKNDGLATVAPVVLTDSLGAGWIFLSATPSLGTSVGSYNPVTSSIDWTVPSLAPGDSAQLIIRAQAASPGSIRNYSWVASINNNPVGHDFKSAYVIVTNSTAPPAPELSPQGTVRICPPATDVLLTANDTTGTAISFQWYHDGIAIPGAINSTHLADTAGFYFATLFNGTCLSNASDTVVVMFGGCMQLFDDQAYVFECGTVLIDVLANDVFTGNPIPVTVSAFLPRYGTASVVGNKIQYTDSPP
jgi:uncharacterized repeat protein (TIGR01451 family)